MLQEEKCVSMHALKEKNIYVRCDTKALKEIIICFGGGEKNFYISLSDSDWL